MGSSESGVNRCDGAPLSPWGPLGGNKGEDETPPRGTEACPGTLAVSEDPAPRDAVTRIPTGLSLAAGGQQVQPRHPQGCPAPPTGPSPFPTELRGASPRAQAPPQSAHGHDGRATRRAFCLASSDCRAARARLGIAAGLPASLGPAGLPARLPSPGTAHPSAAQLNTPQPPPSPPPVGISLALQDHRPPRLRPHHAAVLRDPARASPRLPGPRFACGSTLPGAPIWAGQRDHTREGSDASSIHSGCYRVRGWLPPRAGLGASCENPGAGPQSGLTRVAAGLAPCTGQETHLH